MVGGGRGALCPDAVVRLGSALVGASYEVGGRGIAVRVLGGPSIPSGGDRVPVAPRLPDTSGHVSVDVHHPAAEFTVGRPKLYRSLAPVVVATAAGASGTDSSSARTEASAAWSAAAAATMACAVCSRSNASRIAVSPP